MDKLKESEFPEPEFPDIGELGIDENTYFQRVQVEGQIVNVNDTVLVLAIEDLDDSIESTYCGRVLKLWKSKSGEKLFRVNWFWKRSDVPPEPRQFLLNRELLLSEQTDVIPIDSIKSKITVHPSPDILGQVAHLKADLTTTEYFCNRGYIVSKTELVAYSTVIRLMKMAEQIIEHVDGNTKYDLARARLQLNFVQSVSGRNAEIEQITSILQRFLLQSGRGACLYISGVPGTGKTLCVREVIRNLAKEQLSGEIPVFEYYEVNCLRFETSRDIFSDMWCALSGEKLNAVSAQKMLNDTFTLDPPPNYIVVLVDEVDVLLTNQQNELYCLFEWSSLPHSHLIIICIANLMDLETRLKPKLASRFGKSSVKFYAYKYEELSGIIQSRVGDLDVFEPKAIELCCRKISLIGGDARKCLEACKRAVDLIRTNSNESQHIDKVRVEDMQTTLKELQSIRATDLFMKLTENQQFLLAALIADSRITSRTIIPIRDVLAREKGFHSQNRTKNVLSQNLMLTIANQLNDMRIIKSTKSGLIKATSLISLACMEQDALPYLKKNPKLDKYLNFSTE